MSNGSAVYALVTAVMSLGFSENLLGLVDDITEKYLKHAHCIAYVTDEDTAIWGRHVQIIVNLSSEDYHKYLLHAYDDPCNGFVIRTNRTRRLSVLRELITAYKKSLYGRYNNKRYIILPDNETDDNPDFLHVEDMYFLPNLIFVSPSADKSFSIIGHNYFDGHKYDFLKEKHSQLDSWHRGSFLKNTDLFPDKMMNLNGKQVTLSLMHYSPYALVISNGNDTVFDGVETRIAAQFVESSNGTWIGKDNPKAMWGDIYENGTGTGIFGSILSHTADFGYSAIYQWYCHIMECSYPYIKAGVTCLAPKPEMISGWLTIILPFKATTWLSLIVVYVLVSNFICLITLKWKTLNGIRYLSKWGILCESFLNTFRLQFFQIPKIAHRNTPIAHLYKIWMVYCFFVACCWQGGIASFLTIPRYEQPVNDIHDLTGRFPHLRWGANHDVWIKSIEKSTEPLMVKIVKEFVIADDDTLREWIPKKKFAYFLERLPYGHYGFSSFIDREGIKYLRIMEQNLYYGYSIIIMPRGCPYQERLDTIIHWMFDTGLVQEVEIQVSLKFIDNELQNLIRSSTEKPAVTATSLSASHILGPLMIYSAGSVASIILFLFELTFFKRHSQHILDKSSNKSH